MTTSPILFLFCIANSLATTPFPQASLILKLVVPVILSIFVIPTVARWRLVLKGSDKFP